MKMMGIDILEHTERQLSIEEARQLYESMLEEVSVSLSRCQLALLFTLLIITHTAAVSHSVGIISATQRYAGVQYILSSHICPSS